jgi:phage terminase large subunit-like protein
MAAGLATRELADDRTFAGEIVRNLQDEGLSLVEFGQGFLSMGLASRNSCAF